MENRQTWTKVLSLLAFSIVALNCVFAFANTSSTSFVQVFFVVVMVAIVIASMFLTKDSKAPCQVIGAAILYFFNLVIRAIFFVIDAIIDFFRQLSLGNMQTKYTYDDLGVDDKTALYEKITDLNEKIAKDTIGEVFDILLMIFALVVLAIAVYHIVRIILGKKFSKTLLGKFSCSVVAKEKCSKESIKLDSTKTVEKTQQLEDENEVEEVAVSEDKNEVSEETKND